MQTLDATLSIARDSYAAPSGLWVALFAVLLGALPFFLRALWDADPTRFWRNAASEGDLYVRLFLHEHLPGRSPLAGVFVPDNGGGKYGFLAHLVELRGHVMWMLSASSLNFVLVAVIPGLLNHGWNSGLFFFAGAGDVYGYLAVPLLENLPDSGSLIAIGTVSPISVPMKAAFFVAVCVTMPFMLHEIWSFVAPGLYPWHDPEKKRLVYDEKGAAEGRDEKRLAFGLIATSASLFYAGIAFAYFLVFQVVFKVIAKVTPDAVNWTPDIGEFFGSMLLMFFGFGLVFEVPVAMFILARAGVVELEALKRARPYVVVGAFVLAAIVTPPDVISQLLLAIPCCLLYEFGLVFLNPKEWWGNFKKSLRNLARFAPDLMKFLAYKLRARI